MATTSDALIGASEVAKRLGYSRQTIDGWARRGTAPGKPPFPPPVMLAGPRKERRWRLSEIEAWKQLDDALNPHPEEAAAARASLQKRTRNVIDAIEKVTDYRLTGKSGSGHYVMKHPMAPPIFIGGKLNQSRSAANHLAQAKRFHRIAPTATTQFFDWLCEKYGVGPQEQKEVQFILKDVVDEFFDTNVGIKASRSSMLTMAYSGAYTRLTRLVTGERGEKSTWLLRGRDYIEDRIEPLAEIPEDDDEGVEAEPTQPEAVEAAQPEAVEAEPEWTPVVTQAQREEAEATALHPEPMSVIFGPDTLAKMARDLSPVLDQQRKLLNDTVSLTTDSLASIQQELDVAQEEMERVMVKAREDIDSLMAMLKDITTTS